MDDDGVLLLLLWFLLLVLSSLLLLLPLLCDVGEGGAEREGAAIPWCEEEALGYNGAVGLNGGQKDDCRSRLDTK